MVQRVEIRHDQHQVAGFFHRQKSGPDDGADFEVVKVMMVMVVKMLIVMVMVVMVMVVMLVVMMVMMTYLGTLSPMALSKHFMAAPMAVTS